MILGSLLPVIAPESILTSIKLLPFLIIRRKDFSLFGMGAPILVKQNGI